MDSPEKLPGNLSHLERLITAWGDSADERLSAARIRHIVGALAFIGILGGLKDNNGQDRIALKGGAALELRAGFIARLSQDIDGAYRGSLDEAFTLITESLRTGWANFTGTISDPELINAPGLLLKPRRCRVRLFYKGRSFVTIPFELSSAEGHSLDRPERERSAIALSLVQLPDVGEISFLPIKYQIAQKLHACTESRDDTGDGTNQRARDLYDLLLIERELLVPDSFQEIRAACVEIFELRKTQPWPPVVAAFADWEKIWANLMRTEHTKMTLVEAIARTNDLVSRINAATTIQAT